MQKHFWIYILFALAMLVVSAEGYAKPAKVEIVKQQDHFVLMRNGAPYHVKGAGLIGDNLERVAKFGGNSIRTWSVDNNVLPAQQLLDQAHALGLTVSLGLEFSKERHGFDYNDSAAVAKQFSETKARVLKYKDHPALLTWIIGNELNLGYSNPKVFDAVNQVAEMIKEVDPNHPVTTPLAGFDRQAMSDIQQRAPALDFVSFQLYGDLTRLPKYVEDFGYKGPYFVTEWGTTGHWQVAKTNWGAPIEPTSSEKAEDYLTGFTDAIVKDGDQVIVNYVFLWGQKQERTPTWYGMFLASGEKTEAVDKIHTIWTGAEPENSAPTIGAITLNNKVAEESVYLQSGKNYRAEVEVSDKDNDPLLYQWEIRRESTSQKSGGDKEYIPPVIEGLVVENSQGKARISAPTESGAYRLFVYVFDQNGSAAHANFPFYVE
jgi:hypothetical protein